MAIELVIEPDELYRTKNKQVLCGKCVIRKKLQGEVTLVGNGEWYTFEDGCNLVVEHKVGGE